MLQKPQCLSKIIIVCTPTNGNILKENVANLDNVKDALCWLKVENNLYKDFNLSVSEPMIVTLENGPTADNKNTNHDEFTESSITTDVPSLPQVDFSKHVLGKTSK